MVLFATGILHFCFILAVVNGHHLILDKIDDELGVFNRILANLTWRALTEKQKFDTSLMTDIGELQINWKSGRCSLLSNIMEAEVGTVDMDDLRKKYMLCRGPIYNAEQARKISSILNKLQTLYIDKKVCRGPNLPCYSAEPDLERLFRRSRDEAELLWAWNSWRQQMSPARSLYAQLITYQNVAAHKSGYHNIGECWKEELEILDLEQFVDELHESIAPFYALLHAFVRYRLSMVYGPDVVSLDSSIPAHLLGNLWAQNWDNVMDILVPELANKFDLDNVIRRKNWTVQYMAKEAEVYYSSMGLPTMTETFWRKSIFEKNRQCHGTAANMFSKDDYRILMCAEPSLEDFYVMHHEFGHIQYYMAYNHQPVIFQDGANSAFHESIGDAVMYGVMSPVHLHRLGLVADDQDSDLDIYLLLRSALNKLPQFGFGLALEKWRWGVMSGRIPYSEWNKQWWRLKEKYQGIRPPTVRTEKYFDPAAKFHIMDNTPYIRYYLGGFLQMQIFEALCMNTTETEQHLHKCDIFNSTEAGTKLRKMMSLGSSKHWSEALSILTDGEHNKITSSAILKYYQPLIDWLKFQISKYSIPVEW